MKRRGIVAAVLVAAVALAGCGRVWPVAAGAAASPAPTAVPLPTASPTAHPTAPPPTAAPETSGGEAVMSPDTQYAGVALANNVTPEMLRPDYWLQGNTAADTVLMTAQEIAAFNENTTAALSPAERMFDLGSLGETLLGEEVRLRMLADPAAPPQDCVNGETMPSGYLRELDKRRNMDAIPATVTLRYGVMVDRADARTQPTEDRFSAREDLFFDNVQQAELYWNEPVVILHESDDGAWYYILNCRMDGWVRQDKVALFDTRENWLAWQAKQDFLVVTANRMRLDYNNAEPALSEREISMGTQLPLADAAEAPPSVAGRLTIGNYIAKLPLRADDGSVRFAYAPVPVSADVSRGYLPYTRRNVVSQMFKILGTNYGWGGTQAANDCSGITVQIYRCFGFELPRNSKSLSMLPCSTGELSLMNGSAKAQALRQAPAGSILYFPGHIMLYLGERDGNFYVMSAVGSVDLYGRGRPDRVLTVLINDLNVRRNDGVTWMGQMKSLKIIEPVP